MALFLTVAVVFAFALLMGGLMHRHDAEVKREAERRRREQAAWNNIQPLSAPARSGLVTPVSRQTFAQTRPNTASQTQSLRRSDRDDIGVDLVESAANVADAILDSRGSSDPTYSDDSKSHSSYQPSFVPYVPSPAPASSSYTPSPSYDDSSSRSSHSHSSSSYSSYDSGSSYSDSSSSSSDSGSSSCGGGGD